MHVCWCQSLLDNKWAGNSQSSLQKHQEEKIKPVVGTILQKHFKNIQIHVMFWIGRHGRKYMAMHKPIIYYQLHRHCKVALCLHLDGLESHEKGENLKLNITVFIHYLMAGWLTVCDCSSLKFNFFLKASITINIPFMHHKKMKESQTRLMELSLDHAHKQRYKTETHAKRYFHHNIKKILKLCFVLTLWYRCCIARKTCLRFKIQDTLWIPGGNCLIAPTTSFPFPKLSHERSQPWEWGKPCEVPLHCMNNAEHLGGEWGPRGGAQADIKVSLLLIPSLHFDEEESVLFWGAASQLHSTTTW